MARKSPKGETAITIIRESMAVIRTHEKDAAFCLGYAWGTMNSLLMLFGEQRVAPPWEVSDGYMDPDKAIAADDNGRAWPMAENN